VAPPANKEVEDAFKWAQNVFKNRSLRGDAVCEKNAPRLFRSINRYIPVLKDEGDLYKCLSLLGWGRDEMVVQAGEGDPAEDALKLCLEEIASVGNIGGNKTNVLHVMMAFLEGWLKLNRPGRAYKLGNRGTVQEKKDYTLKLLMLVFFDKN